MKTGTYKLCALSLGLFLFIPVAANLNTAEAAIVIPDSFSFNLDLKQGLTVSPDVQYLQAILNASPNTKVAETGAGSNFELTSTFGSKTKNAVMRFQSYYAASVLAPAGLTSATGVVGPLTRAKLNQILQAARNAKTTAYATSTSGTGSIVTTSAGATAATGSAPTITSVSPASSKFLTQVVVLTGTNFTTSNTVKTNLGNLDGVFSADGRNLTFTIGTLPYYQRALQAYKGKQINLVIGVSTEFGSSLEQAIHVISLPASGSIADASPVTTEDILQGIKDLQQLAASSSASTQSSSFATTTASFTSGN